MADVYVVTVHDGGGSHVEAADALYALGWFTDMDMAQRAAARLSFEVCAVDEYTSDQWWATVQTVTLPTVSPEDAARLELTRDQAIAEFGRIVADATRVRQA